MENLKKCVRAVLFGMCIFVLSGCAKVFKTEQMEWKMKSCDIESFKGIIRQIDVITDNEFFVIVANNETEIRESVYYVNLENKSSERIPLEIDEKLYLSEIAGQGRDKYVALLSEKNGEGNDAKDVLIVANLAGTVLSKQELKDITSNRTVKRIMVSGNMVLIATEDCIYCLDENLRYIKSYKTKNQIEDAVLVGKERIICKCKSEKEYENSKARFCGLNLTKEIWEDDFLINLEQNEMVLRLIKGRGDSFYFAGMKGIYDCSEKGISTSVLRYNELGLTNDESECIVALQAEGFMGCRADEAQMISELCQICLEKVDGRRDKLVIGGVGIDGQAVAKIMEFNKKDTGVQIEIKDYMDNLGVSFMDACNRLYTDILAGNGPDIVYLQGIDTNHLIKQGYLENLDRYYENDGELSRDDLIPSFREAISVDGSMYYLVSDFGMITMVGKSSMVGENMGWDMQELYELWKKRRCIILPESNEMIFRNLIRGMVQDENIAIEDFKKALEVSKQGYPDEMEHNEGIKNNEVLLEIFGNNSPMEIQMMHAVFDEEEITLKGFPDVDGSGAMFVVWNAWGMSSKSEHKDTAWKVIRLLMTKGYQSITAGNVVYYPSRLDCFEEKLREYGNEKSSIFQELDKEWSYYEDKGVYVALSNEDIERIKRMVYETKTVYILDSALEAIVNEEAQGYISGDKDINTVCELIKNRIDLYRKEN